MDKDILDELNRIADGFWKDRQILDINKINQIRHLRAGHFALEFSDALKDFLKIRRFDTNNNSDIDELVGLNPKRDYEEACDKFLEVITVAKQNDLIIDKEIVKKLDDLNEQHSKHETENEQNKTTIQKQKEIIDQYRKKIKSVLELHPTLASAFGVQESEVEEN